MPKENIRDDWNKKATDLLLGASIVKVEYLPLKDTKQSGWCRSPITIHLSNGIILIPSSDDEGNNGGALQYLKDNEWEVFPVI